MVRNDGKALEEATRRALQHHHLCAKSNFMRLYDATSSGGRGHAQGADFIWTIPNPKAAVLIECKSSAIGTSLLTLIRASKRGKEQVNKHRLHHISGHPSMYIYGNLLNDEVQIFDGKEVALAITTRQRGISPITTADMRSISASLNRVVEYLWSYK